jgi:nucleoside-diphosphate-sugar epimerase
MRVYVTGASGFVGKSLINQLDNQGFDAWAVVRNKTERIKEVVLDLKNCSEDEMAKLMYDANCIVHLAANANFGVSFNEDIYDINCLSNLALVNFCKKYNIYIIFASNALISGLNKEHISNISLDNPEIPYNISKYISEQYLIKNLKNYCILRIGGIYGIDGPKHLFLNKIIDDVLNLNKNIILSNDGNALRNYIYVEDLAAWIIHIIKKQVFGKVLIAGPEILSLNGILNRLNNVFFDLKIITTKSKIGMNQIIDVSLPDLNFLSYEKAFEDIKSKQKLK